MWVKKWLPGKAIQCSDLRPLPVGRDEGSASDPDEGLVDECCLLPSQLLVPNLDWLPASDGLVSRLQPKQPLRLRFGRAPILPSNSSTLQLDSLSRCACCPPTSVSTPQGLCPSENFVFHLCCVRRGVWFCPVEPGLASDSVGGA